MNQEINSYLSPHGEALMFAAIMICKDYTDEQKEQVINAWNNDHKPKNKSSRQTKLISDMIMFAAI